MLAAPMLLAFGTSCTVKFRKRSSIERRRAFILKRNSLPFDSMMIGVIVITILEELITAKLKEIPILQSGLAKYNGKAAIFWRYAPEETDPLWDAGNRFPCLICHSKLGDTDGSVTLSLFCPAKPVSNAEKMISTIKSAFSGLILSAEQTLTCFLWKQTAHRSMEKEHTALSRNCISIEFSVFSQPVLESSLPISVRSICQSIQEVYPHAKIPGFDEIHSGFISSESDPVIQVREKTTSYSHASLSCVWMKSDLLISVLLPDMELRKEMIRKLFHYLSHQGNVEAADGSLYLIKELTCTPDKTAFHGQIQISGEFGILKEESEDPILQHILFE